MTERSQSVYRSAYASFDSKPFISLSIRRSHLIQDSLQQLSEYKEELKKPLRISFVDEPGIDLSGLTKEWLLLLCRQLFDPQVRCSYSFSLSSIFLLISLSIQFGMFILNEETQLMWFNPSTLESVDEFYLVGLAIGLAIYNGVTLDVPLPLVRSLSSYSSSSSLLTMLSRGLNRQFTRNFNQLL